MSYFEAGLGGKGTFWPLPAGKSRLAPVAPAPAGLTEPAGRKRLKGKGGGGQWAESERVIWIFGGAVCSVPLPRPPALAHEVSWSDGAHCDGSRRGHSAVSLGL